jgi:cytochrome o ubiquinol oxidase subunit 3
MTGILTTHHARDPLADTSVPDPHQDTYSKNVLGFWMYLMTDCLVFASLFVTYAILHGNTFGGPSSKELFHLPTALSETAMLLLSTVSCGFAMIHAKNSETRKALVWLGVTFVLGASFLATELTEFTHLVQSGNSWQRSAFLSSFFTLVGTHGLHIAIGLFWMLVMMTQVALWGINVHTFRRLVMFSLFWHFLDLVWIFIFTFVYLMGVQ